MTTPTQPASSSTRQSTGRVTKILDNFGFIEDSIFFPTSVVKGGPVKVGDRVYFECTYSDNLPFKWNATVVQILQPQQQQQPPQPTSQQQQQQMQRSLPTSVHQQHHAVVAPPSTLQHPSYQQQQQQQQQQQALQVTQQSPSVPPTQQQQIHPSAAASMYHQHPQQAAAGGGNQPPPPPPPANYGYPTNKPPFGGPPPQQMYGGGVPGAPPQQQQQQPQQQYQPQQTAAPLVSTSGPGQPVTGAAAIAAAAAAGFGSAADLAKVQQAVAAATQLRQYFNPTATVTAAGAAGSQTGPAPVTGRPDQSSSAAMNHPPPQQHPLGAPHHPHQPPPPPGSIQTTNPPYVTSGGVGGPAGVVGGTGGTGAGGNAGSGQLQYTSTPGAAFIQSQYQTAAGNQQQQQQQQQKPQHGGGPSNRIGGGRWDHPRDPQDHHLQQQHHRFDQSQQQQQQQQQHGQQGQQQGPLKRGPLSGIGRDDPRSGSRFGKSRFSDIDRFPSSTSSSASSSSVGPNQMNHHDDHHNRFGSGLGHNFGGGGGPPDHFRGGGGIGGPDRNKDESQPHPISRFNREKDRDFRDRSSRDRENNNIGNNKLADRDNRRDNDKERSNNERRERESRRNDRGDRSKRSISPTPSVASSTTGQTSSRSSGLNFLPKRRYEPCYIPKSTIIKHRYNAAELKSRIGNSVHIPSDLKEIIYNVDSEFDLFDMPKPILFKIFNEKDSKETNQSKDSINNNNYNNNINKSNKIETSGGGSGVGKTVTKNESPDPKKSKNQSKQQTTSEENSDKKQQEKQDSTKTATDTSKESENQSEKKENVKDTTVKDAVSDEKDIKNKETSDATNENEKDENKDKDKSKTDSDKDSIKMNVDGESSQTSQDVDSLKPSSGDVEKSTIVENKDEKKETGSQDGKHHQHHHSQRALNHKFNVKVLLITLPPLAEIYEQLFGTEFAAASAYAPGSGADRSSSKNQVKHFHKLLSILVAKNSNDGYSLIGGKFLKDQDGYLPGSNEPNLVATSIRIVWEQTGLNLSTCRQWRVFATFIYNRDNCLNQQECGYEITKIYFPDIWSALDVIYKPLKSIIKSITNDNDDNDNNNVDDENSIGQKHSSIEIKSEKTTTTTTTTNITNKTILDKSETKISMGNNNEEKMKTETTTATTAATTTTISPQKSSSMVKPESSDGEEKIKSIHEDREYLQSILDSMGNYKVLDLKNQLEKFGIKYESRLKKDQLYQQLHKYVMDLLKNLDSKMEQGDGGDDDTMDVTIGNADMITMKQDDEDDDDDGNTEQQQQLMDSKDDDHKSVLVDNSNKSDQVNEKTNPSSSSNNKRKLDEDESTDTNTNTNDNNGKKLKSNHEESVKDDDNDNDGGNSATITTSTTPTKPKDISISSSSGNIIESFSAIPSNIKVKGNFYTVTLQSALNPHRFDQFELSIVAEFIRDSLIIHFSRYIYSSLLYNIQLQKPIIPIINSAGSGPGGPGSGTGNTPVGGSGSSSESSGTAAAAGAAPQRTNTPANYVHLAFSYFDKGHCGYMPSDDLNQLFSMTGISLSKKSFNSLVSSLMSLANINCSSSASSILNERIVYIFFQQPLQLVSRHVDYPSVVDPMRTSKDTIRSLTGLNDDNYDDDIKSGDGGPNINQLIVERNSIQYNVDELIKQSEMDQKIKVRLNESMANATKKIERLEHQINELEIKQKKMSTATGRQNDELCAIKRERDQLKSKYEQMRRFWGKSINDYNAMMKTLENIVKTPNNNVATNNNNNVTADNNPGGVTTTTTNNNTLDNPSNNNVNINSNNSQNIPNLEKQKPNQPLQSQPGHPQQQQSTATDLKNISKKPDLPLTTTTTNEGSNNKGTGNVAATTTADSVPVAAETKVTVNGK